MRRSTPESEKVKPLPPARPEKLSNRLELHLVRLVSRLEREVRREVLLHLRRQLRQNRRLHSLLLLDVLLRQLLLALWVSSSVAAGLSIPSPTAPEVIANGTKTANPRLGTFSLRCEAMF